MDPVDEVLGCAFKDQSSRHHLHPVSTNIANLCIQKDPLDAVFTGSGAYRRAVFAAKQTAPQGYIGLAIRRGERKTTLGDAVQDAAPDSFIFLGERLIFCTCGEG